jgi:hypothetical protein
MIAKCSCQHCKKPIQFETDELKSGKKVECPHCKTETALLIPAEKELERFISTESIPAWFALLAGLIYATGFLIQFTFLSSIGIKESVTEVFKAKYIYVGLLCWQFPVCLALRLLGCKLVKHKRKREEQERQLNLKLNPSFVVPDDQKKREADEDAKTRIYWPSVTIFTLPLIVFYVLTVFTPPGYFSAHQTWVLTYFIFAFFSLNLLRSTEEWVESFRKKNPGSAEALKRIGHAADWTWGERLRITACIISCGLLVLIFDPIHPDEVCSRLWEMFFVNNGFWYFIFIAMGVYLLWWYHTSLKSYFFRHRLDFRLEYWAMALPIPATFFYLAVLTFAHHIYPYIPAERGGGDYTAEQASILTFDVQFSNSIPAEIFDASRTNLQSRKAVVLDETANMIYIALPTNGLTEIAAWRQNLPPTTNHPNSRPQKIFAIKREAVVSERSEPW